VIRRKNGEIKRLKEAYPSLTYRHSLVEKEKVSPVSEKRRKKMEISA